MKRANNLPISFVGWDIVTDPELDAVLAPKMAEAISATFTETPPDADLPFGWGPNSDGRFGEGVEDPLTIYVTIPLGPECQEPEWKTSISELVDDFIELVEGEPERTTKLRDALLAEVHKLERSMEQ